LYFEKPTTPAGAASLPPLVLVIVLDLASIFLENEDENEND
jgi:hypothetical protein